MRVALLGLGLMGRALGERLQQEGFDLHGWNRSAAGAEAARAAGLRVHPRAADAAAGADALLLALADAAAIEAVLFAAEAPPALAGRLVIQTGTIAPEESRALGARVEAAGGTWLEAPVLGSRPEARAGTLILMAGGTPEAFARALPLLLALGPEPRLVGPVGQGAALKLAMNQLIAALTTGFAQSLGLVRAEGVDVGLFMELLRHSALYAPTFDKKLQRYLTHDYGDPNFPLQHLLKDTALFEGVAARAGQETAVVAAMRRLFERACAAGLAGQDYSALYEALNGGTG